MKLGEPTLYVHATQTQIAALKIPGKPTHSTVLLAQVQPNVAQTTAGLITHYTALNATATRSVAHLKVMCIPITRNASAIQQLIAVANNIVTTKTVHAIPRLNAVARPTRKIHIAQLKICRPVIPTQIAAMNFILPTKTVHVTVKITVAKIKIGGQTSIVFAIRQKNAVLQTTMTGKKTRNVHATKTTTVALMLLTSTLGNQMASAFVLKNPYAAQVTLMITTSFVRAK